MNVIKKMEFFANFILNSSLSIDARFSFFRFLTLPYDIEEFYKH